MKIVFDVTNMNNIGTAFSLPEGSDVELSVKGKSYTNVGKMLDVRERALSLEERLGLRNEIPKDQLLEALKSLRAQGGLGRSRLEEHARKTGLIDWLSASANLATLADGLFKLQTSGFLDAAIAAIAGAR